MEERPVATYFFLDPESKPEHHSDPESKHHSESSGSFPIYTDIDEEDTNEKDPNEEDTNEEDTNEKDPNESQSSDFETDHLSNQEEPVSNPVASAGTVVPAVALQTLVDDWIKKKNTVADTIMDTNLLIQNLTGEAFEKHVDTITNILEQAKDADGVPIFKNRADIVDYIQKIRNNRKKQHPLKEKRISVPQRLQDDVSLENRYSRMISPLMKRSILSNTIRKSNLYAFQ